MCFSASASFVTAGITGTVGAIAITRTTERREVPLAATPLLFAVQQVIEGLLWLDLPVAPGGPFSTALVLMFLFFAEAFWPVYAPVAVLLIEPNDWRRPFIVASLGIGVGVGGYLLWSILSAPVGATLVNGHIVYLTEYRHSVIVGFAYPTAVGLPLLLSSHRTVVVLGAIVLAGLAVAYAFYWEAFVSVWCFFAAAATLTILGHFEWSRRRLAQLAGA